MAVQRHVSSDSGPCKVDNPYKCEIFWERFHRRQEPLTRSVYSSLRRSCAEDVLESLHLEPKNLITNYLGQVDEAPNEKISEVDDVLVHETPPHSSQENEKLVPKWPRSWKREDTVLRKHLCRTRQHVLAVKQGRSYFRLLQKEEQEAQEEQRRERQRREELRRTKLRPPTRSDSDEDSDTERWCDVVATSSIDWKPNRRKLRAARPFTPIHRSLISTPPHLLPGECVYRQLCCLNWLLEALTLERSGRAGPVTSCWDARDPGMSRTTIKRLNKEKAIEAKWEQFIAPPKTRHLTSRPLRVSSGRQQLWKTSALSVLSSSVTGSSAGSLLSLAPAPDHTCDESVYTKAMETLSVRESDSDPSSSEYLQKFLQEVYQSVLKTCCYCDKQLTSASDSDTSVKVHPESKTQKNTAGEKTGSQRVQSSPATAQLIHKKEVMLCGMKASFVDIAEELTLNLSDALDRCAKKRWDFGVQRYRCLCNMLSRGRIRSAVTSETSVVSPRAPDSNIPDSTEDPYSTQWLSAFLSNLASIKHSDRRVARLLEKLSRFTDGHAIQLHPHNFLRILTSLQPWELCCPDLCVAIEIVRLNVVKMPKAEYDSWLHSRINQSQTTKSAAHNL
ncbi:coiled-coil domain-containing protein 60-like [Onychostoma macrolepis]|uniref:coiled-coil domain-containing protein 60-like n=1 Tax=Onychostoma macrolepis TaxID=369639 RepID=UPI002729C8A5|nr:coiled-coil domain-containing protein 60-like [Onychostoma macrolepis]